MFVKDNRLEDEVMTVEHGIRILAGSLILISVALTLLVSPYWLMLTGFVGLNLIQSALTGFCPAEIVLRRIMSDTRA